MNTETEEASLLKSTKQHRTCKLSHAIIVAIVTIILTAFLTNIDRIVDALKSNEDSTNIPNYDTIIIGGGPAGMLQLHLLQKYKHNDYKVLLLEKLNRVGGRTFTTHIRNKETNSKIFFDHGGARCKYNHIYIMKVLNYLNMCDELIPFSHYNLTNYNPIQSYRSISVQTNDNKYQNNSFFVNLYNLNEFEKHMVLNNGTKYVYQYILEQIILENEDTLKYPQNQDEYATFLNNYTYQNKPLYNYSPWTILRALNFSFEFITMMAENEINQWTSQQYAPERYGGYYELSEIGNTINNYSQYGYWTLINGFDAISQKLYNLTYNYNKEKQNILLNNKAISIEKIKNKYHIQSKDLITNVVNIFAAENVILSIDVSNLKQLIPYIPVLDNEKVKYLLDSVIIVYNTRINLIYDDSFWIDHNLIDLSRSRTTSEMLIVYIEESWSDNNLTSIMLNPCNEQSEFWEMLQVLDNELYTIDENIEIISPDINTLVVASNSVVKHALKMLNNLWSEYINFTIPMPLAAFYDPWGYDLDFGDSVANWKSGYKVNNILNNIFHPNKNENIFIAVNDFSLNQGWSDGAYWAAIQNLVRNFNIPDIFQNKTQCVPQM